MLHDTAIWQPSPGWQFTLLDATFEGQSQAAIKEHEAGLTLISAQIGKRPTAISIDPGYACSGIADILAATPAPKMPEPPPDARKLPFDELMPVVVEPRLAFFSGSERQSICKMSNRRPRERIWYADQARSKRPACRHHEKRVCPTFIGCGRFRMGFFCTSFAWADRSAGTKAEPDLHLRRRSSVGLSLRCRTPHSQNAES